MFPTLYSFGVIQIHAYGLLVAIGVLFGIYLLRRNAFEWDQSPDVFVDLALFVVFFGFVGARIFYVAQYWDYFREAPLEALQIWKGGVVFYGGVIGAFLAFVVAVKLKHLPFALSLDLMVPSIALTQGFGRIGCFLNGCCYGSPFGGPWAVQFPFHDHTVHPTQLYESFYCFGLAGFLLWLLGRVHRRGMVACSYFIFYAVGRFFLEYVRGDNLNVASGMTVPQTVSVVVMIIGASAWVWLKQHGRKAYRS